MPTRDRWAGRPLVALLALAAALRPAPAGAQEGEPVVFRAKALEVAIAGRVQTLFSTTSVETEPATEIALRRVRLEANVRVNELVSAKVQPEFAGSRVSLRDAYVRFAFHPALNLVAGQANRPFGTIVPTSSTRILPIERGVRIRGLDEALDHHNLITSLGYADRDVGLQLTGEPEGAPLGLSYALGVFEGPARALAGAEDTYQLVGRVSVRPAASLRVGASVSSRDFVEAEEPPADVRRVERGTAWAADVEYGSYAPGLHLLGEVAYGDHDPFAGTRMLGAQGWAAFRTRELGPRLTHLEPVLRVSAGDTDVEDRRDVQWGGTLLTPGINLYFGPLNRIMLNYDVWLPEQGSREGSFKVMFQAAF